jgi:hypothetical protein
MQTTTRSCVGCTTTSTLEILARDRILIEMSSQPDGGSVRMLVQTLVNNDSGKLIQNLFQVEIAILFFVRVRGI